MELGPLSLAKPPVKMLRRYGAFFAFASRTRVGPGKYLLHIAVRFETNTVLCSLNTLQLSIVAFICKIPGSRVLTTIGWTGHGPHEHMMCSSAACSWCSDIHSCSTLESIAAASTTLFSTIPMLSTFDPVHIHSHTSSKYCKPLYVRVPFISRISRA